MLEKIFYVFVTIGFAVLVADTVLDFIKSCKKRKAEKTIDIKAIQDKIDNIWLEITDQEDTTDRLEDRLMGKIEIVDTSIMNLSNRTQELEEMIRYYAGELKYDELKEWTYIQPDGSIKTHTLKEDIADEPPDIKYENLIEESQSE